MIGGKRIGYALASLAIGLVATAAAGAVGVWQEAEAFSEIKGQVKQTHRKRTPASGGSALYGEVMRSEGNEAIYKVEVPAPIRKARLILRYARGPQRPETKPAEVSVHVEDPTCSVRERLSLPTTGGWGAVASQWRWAGVEVGPLAGGEYVVRLRSEANGSDVNIDGFYITDIGVRLAPRDMSDLQSVALNSQGYLGIIVPKDRPGVLLVQARDLDGADTPVKARWRSATDRQSSRPVEKADGEYGELTLPGGGIYRIIMNASKTNIKMTATALVTGDQTVFLDPAAGEKILAMGDVLGELRPGHPRLFLTDDRLAELKSRHASDPTLQKIVADILTLADTKAAADPVVYKLKGPRLLFVSREMLSRMYSLGLAYRWTGDRKYFDAAMANLDAVCAFKDWHPSHFLDTAEMTHAVAVGYDWFYNDFTPAQRERVRAGLRKHGLDAAMAAYAGAPFGWWTNVTHNWNQVCNGSMVIGSLAVGETDGDIARLLTALAVSNLPLALTEYAPDGAWGEGPGYWGYATNYMTYAFAAMETALGHDFDLSKTVGVDKAGEFPLFCAGPTGYYFNYADSHDFTRHRPQPALLWLGRRFGRPWFVASELAMIQTAPADVRHLIWYPDSSATESAPTDLDKYFRGPVEVVIMRNAWDNPDAIWLAVKAGFNQVNHGQLDLGGFELDALGVRWARDLGSDDYNMPGYFEGMPGGRRWTYYRNRSISHSVPLLDGADQVVTASANVADFTSTADRAHAIIDFTEGYAPKSAKSQRGMALVAGRSAVLVQDEFDLVEPAEVTWAMTTDAVIDIAGDSAELTLDGKQLSARILAPADASFTMESAERKPPEKSNEGVSRLLVRVPAKLGPCRVVVLLAPSADIDNALGKVEVKALETW